jgi:hypothetical protein
MFLLKKEAFMDTGMLWFSANKSADLLAEINAAARYYQNKYGRSPNLCFVHPNTMEKIDSQHGASISIKPDKTVLPGHLWIGVDEKLPTGGD